MFKFWTIYDKIFIILFLINMNEEQEILNVLRKIKRNPDASQRKLAKI